MYDAKNKRGLIYYKLIYQKYGKATKKTDENENAVTKLPQSESEKSSGITIDEELAFLLYFRTCIVDRDKEVLKVKLKQTIAMREKLIKKKDTCFHKVFPFYFISPDLVHNLN